MKKILILTLLMIGCGVTLQAQTRRALRINEVMVLNDSSLVDDYGQHAAWIEIFNSNFAPIDIAKVYITDDPANPTKYPIPLGDKATNIKKRQMAIFWADNMPEKGTFHTNLQLIPGKENFIAIYDTDGKTLIDSVTIPASLQPNQSYARKTDGFGDWTIRKGSKESFVTPNANNVLVTSNSKVDFFDENDKNGFSLTILAMGIVFSALLLLCICFYIISKIGESVLHRNKVKTTNTKNTENKKMERRHDSGEEIAAIVMALHEHLNVHDRESTILTLNRVKKAYSPWNSKIYNMRQIPFRKVW